MANEHAAPHGASETEPTQKREFPELTFDNLSGPMKEALARAGWTDLTPVQKKAIPYLVAGKDVMVQARTGSGKTGAFVLPLLSRIDPRNPKCQALVLVPTRELARQVAQDAMTLVGKDDIRVVAVYGGVGYKAQIEAFQQGAQLVVGTPGRILDHLLKRALTLDDLRVLIFDEADRMLSVGFYPDMKELQRYLPKARFSAFMFSATYPQSVLRLADEFLRKPELLSLSGDQVHVAEIEHVFIEVPAMNKDRVLIRLIEIENPTSAIIFCNTKNNVEYVAAILKQHGFDAEDLSSNLSQGQRDRVLTRIREGKLRFLVATDVAARGIDIPRLSHVFLYESPEDPESYIHRGGRTGRAGASGTVITLVDVRERIELGRIAARYGMNMQERKVPEETEVISVIDERITALLEHKRRNLTQIQAQRVSRFMPSAHKFAESEETMHLLAMLLDEHYQRSLNTPAPEPETRPQSTAPQRRRRPGKPRR